MRNYEQNITIKIYPSCLCLVLLYRNFHSSWNKKKLGTERTISTSSYTVLELATCERPGERLFNAFSIQIIFVLISVIFEKPTILHYMFKKVIIHFAAFTKITRVNATDYEVKLVDTAGQDMYSIFPAQYSMDFHGYVLVYSITSTESFEVVQIIYEKLLDVMGKPK